MLGAPPHLLRRHHAVVVALTALAFATAAVAALGAVRSIRHRGTPPTAQHFRVFGHFATALAPGRSAVINPYLINPHRYALSVDRVSIAIAVDAKHARAGCRASRDYRVVEIPRRAYPLTLRPRQTSTLAELGVRTAQLPELLLRDLPGVDQDVCQGARLTLRYGGHAWRVR